MVLGVNLIEDGSLCTKWLRIQFIVYQYAH